MTYFSKKTVVITGAGSGIGYALASHLSAQGAVVYAADRNREGLQHLQKNTAYPLQILEVDVCSREQVEALITKAHDETGRLDFVFNNAGIVIGGDFENTLDSSWEKIVDVNFLGVVYGVQHAYRIMRRQGYGHIINTSSSAGLTPVARSVAYAATKHAVVGLSLSLREEARRTGVRVSVVIPGIVDTGIFNSAINTKGFDYSASINKVPIAKISPDQAAKAIIHGVMKNKAFIIFPLYNKIIMRLYRWFPSVMGRIINSQTMKD